MRRLKINKNKLRGIKTTFDRIQAMMLNKAMERKLETEEAIDLADRPREGHYYVLNEDDALEAEGNMDFCDARTEEWIWSIGRRHSDAAVLASTRADLYDNPYFKCLWLR